MEVFLIPVGHGRHELYCEERDEGEGDRAPVSRLERLRVRLREMIADAEARSPGENVADVDRADRGWLQRGRERVLRWVAERIAEQRLLWHLRRQRTATLVYPEDMKDADALRMLRRGLERDLASHRRWLVFDSLVLIVSLLLVLLPGPNVLAYYFLFRVVGHYLSMRGARQGLQQVSWEARPSSALKELRRAATLDPPARDEQVQHVASQLQLQHLVRFFERTAVT
ncbi:MAG: hypothetical protein HYZ58_04260 [Acidobacteria bacterium]|nr:hypothetical protein [Acidobacteriota bacterium]MBI3262348.1 hypothetical protein [Acidobacteriota bacterium]